MIKLKEEGKFLTKDQKLFIFGIIGAIIAIMLTYCNVYIIQVVIFKKWTQILIKTQNSFSQIYLINN